MSFTTDSDTTAPDQGGGLSDSHRKDMLVEEITTRIGGMGEGDLVLDEKGGGTFWDAVLYSTSQIPY